MTRAAPADGAAAVTAFSLEVLLARIVPAVRAAPRSRAILVGISGIDGAGKGCMADGLVDTLRRSGFNVVVIHADGWLNLP